jgi:hypothetical protein
MLMKKTLLTLMIVALLVCLCGDTTSYAAAKKDTYEAVCGGLVFDIPADFEEESENEFMSETNMIYMSITENEDIDKDDLLEYQNNEEELLDEVEDLLGEMFEDEEIDSNYDQEMVTLKYKNKRLVGQTYKYKGKDSADGSFYLTWILDKDSGNLDYVVAFFFMPTKETDKLYDDIIASARIYDGKSTKSKDSGKDSGKSSGKDVDQELKAFLDEYEAFIDEYCVFMEGYIKNPGDLSKLSNYSELVEKQSEYMEQLQEYDVGKMSAADYAYFVEVTTRCNKKLLDCLD